MCRELFVLAAGKLNCPIRLLPKCHPKAEIEAYIDSAKGTVTLCCKDCESPLAIIHTKHGKEKKNGRKTRRH